MLDGLDSIEWGSLRHAYGDASDVPEILRSLLSPEASKDAAYELFGNIWHQGTVYPATSAAIPFLYEILAAPKTPDRPGIALLIACIAAGRGFLDGDILSPSYEQTWREILAKQGESLEEAIARGAAVTASVRRAVSPGLPSLVPFLEDDESDIRRAVASALGEYPEHANLSLPALEAAVGREVDEEARDAIREAIDRLI